MKKIRVVIVVIFIAALAVAAYALRPKPYVIVDVPGATHAVALAVNERGQVIIQHDPNGDNAVDCLWQNGKLKPLPGFQPSFLNDAGDIAGSKAHHNAVWRNGVLTNILTPGYAYSREIGIARDGAMYLIALSGLHHTPYTHSILLWRNGSVRTLFSTRDGLLGVCVNGRAMVVSIYTLGPPYLTRQITVIDGPKRMNIPIPAASQRMSLSLLGLHDRVILQDDSGSSHRAWVWDPQQGLQEINVPTGKVLALTCFTDSGSALGTLMTGNDLYTVEPVEWTPGRLRHLPTYGLNWMPMGAASNGMIVGSTIEQPRISYLDRLRAMFHFKIQAGGGTPIYRPIIWPAGTLR